MTKLIQMKITILRQLAAVAMLSLGLMACGGGEESSDLELELQQKTLTVEVEGGGTVGGDVECSSVCSSVVEHDATIEIVATAASGYVFQQWNGACSGSGSCQVVMSSNKTVAAVFVEQDETIDEFTLTVSKNGFGAVSSTPSGIDCGTDCSESYQQGTSVTLEATADSGHVFTGWSGACSGSETCVVSINQAQSVTASFQEILEPELVELSVSVSGQGTVTSSPAGINCGSDCSQEYELNTSVSLTATAEAGSEFVAWGGACSGSSTCNVNLATNLTVTAVFQELGSQNFSLTTSVVGNGSIASTPSGISCGSDCEESYAEDTQVTLVASAETGFEFNGWSGACSGTGSCSVTMNSNKSVTAEFVEEQPSTFDLNVTVIGDGRVTSSPNGIDCAGDCNETFDEGTSVTLTATPDPGYELDYWQGDCSGNSSCSVEMNANADVTARFKAEGTGSEILIENYSPQGDAFQIDNIPDDASGITWHPGLEQYLVVQNGAARIHRYDVNFAYMGNIRVNGINTDTEGLAFVNDNEVLIVSEDNAASRITVDEFVENVSGLPPTSQRYQILAASGGNQGLEGISVRKASGGAPARVYACKEGGNGRNFKVVYFDMPADSSSEYNEATNLTVIEPFNAQQAFNGSANDLAGMVYDERTGHLIIVSQQSRRALQVNPDTGAIISTLDLSGAPQFEGVTIGPNNELVFVSEANWIRIYELN